MKKFPTNFRYNFLKKFSLKSSQSVPIISSEKIQENSNRNSQMINQRKTTSSLSNIKSAVLVQNRPSVQQSHEHLAAMNRIIDETDENLRQALEHATIRHEQLDKLHNRSEEMLQKNENLVFGITNYRKTQERDIFWRRFQYTAFGMITIAVIILLILLSMISKRSTTTSSSQILDIRYSNQDLRSQRENEKKSNLTMTVSRRRRRRKRQREILI